MVHCEFYYIARVMLGKLRSICRFYIIANITNGILYSISDLLYTVEAHRQRSNDSFIDNDGTVNLQKSKLIQTSLRS